jgi:hypothetical protein
MRRDVHFHVIEMVGDLGAPACQQVEQFGTQAGPSLRIDISHCGVLVESSEGNALRSWIGSQAGPISVVRGK